MKVEIFKINKDAKIPDQTFKHDTGFDIYSIEYVEIPSREWRLVKTGIAIVTSEKIQTEIRSRSGLAMKYGVAVLNSPGTIDSQYRGEIGVLLINHGLETFKVAKGDGIAQLVFSKPVPVELSKVDSFDTTERGDFGFGSG